MSDYATGLIMGMALSNQEEGGDSVRYKIEISKCEALATKAETFECLKKVEKTYQEEQLSGVVFLGGLLVVLIIVVSFVWRAAQ